MIGPGIPGDALVQVLCQVGRVERLSDLGSNGPLLASAGFDSLFHCVFGCDALRVAHDLIDDFPAVAPAALLELAKLQRVRLDNGSEEEPGRILHELRAPDGRSTRRAAEASRLGPSVLRQRRCEAALGEPARRICGARRHPISWTRRSPIARSTW